MFSMKRTMKKVHMNRITWMKRTNWGLVCETNVAVLVLQELAIHDLVVEHDGDAGECNYGLVIYSHIRILHSDITKPSAPSY